jgi:hypothetical protein
MTVFADKIYNDDALEKYLKEHQTADLLPIQKKYRGKSFYTLTMNYLIPLKVNVGNLLSPFLTGLILLLKGFILMFRDDY